MAKKYRYRIFDRLDLKHQKIDPKDLAGHSILKMMLMEWTRGEQNHRKNAVKRNPTKNLTNCEKFRPPESETTNNGNHYGQTLSLEK